MKIERTRKMMIVDAQWTFRYNVLTVECDCGYEFEHRADRWKVNCPECGKWEHLNDLRERYKK